MGQGLRIFKTCKVCDAGLDFHARHAALGVRTRLAGLGVGAGDA